MFFEPLSLIFATLASILPSWPDESALGFNAGISPAKSGVSLLYAKGANQWNIGMLYSIGGENPDQTNVRLGFTYDRILTDWGLFVATGLNMTYVVEAGSGPSTNTEDPGSYQGEAWRSRGITNPEWLITVGEQLWFGRKNQFGLNADIGMGYAMATYVDDRWQGRIGAGVSYRYRID